MTTALYAALLGLVLIALSYNVIKARQKYRVALGDKDEPVLRRYMRSQANFVEYTPIFLILLGLVEYQGLPAFGVHILGLMFLGGRISHAYGVGFKEEIKGRALENSHFRSRGMILTFVCIASCAAIALIQYAIYLVS